MVREAARRMTQFGACFIQRSVAGWLDWLAKHIFSENVLCLVCQNLEVVPTDRPLLDELALDFDQMTYVTTYRAPEVLQATDKPATLRYLEITEISSS